MTLKQAKAQATKSEHNRVYRDMNAPQDIRLSFNGHEYVRYCWSSVRHFGWGRWEKLA